MYVKCWQCSEQIDTISVEQQIYQSIIKDLRGMLCSQAIDDLCFLDWRHEDCKIISDLIQKYKEKL